MPRGGKRKGAGRKRGLGKCINDKGYWQISAGPDSGLYEHRVVVRDALRVSEGYWAGVQEIPKGFTVHHIDFVKTHNCLGNLLLLDKTLHDALSVATYSYRCRGGEGEEVPF